MGKVKGKCKRRILVEFIICILLMILLVFLVKNLSVFTPKGAKEMDDLAEVLTKVDEQIVASDTMHYLSTTQHECRNYLESKYDTTNHWEECSICGTKYNQATHTYEEYWTMGESCSPTNKCIHTCSCGYSYQSNNTREHSFCSLRAEPANYRHFQQCEICITETNVGNCIKEDGTIITCGNLGTCTICGHVYSQAKHYGTTSRDGNVECTKCGKYIGTVSNLMINYLSSNTFEFSYDVSVSDTGNFDSSSLSVSNQDVNGNGATSLSHIKANKTSTSVNITGKLEVRSQEIKYYFNSYLRNYYVNSNDLISYIRITFTNITPDQEPPVISGDIVQRDLATSNGWATQKQLTISGTENYCSSVKLTLKDSEGNIYLNNASTMVRDNAWSYTFIPNIEADETGKEFTITATDNLGNSSEKTFMVYKTDKKAPTVTSASETAKDWTKAKDFTFMATDEGSGGVSIALNNTNDYVVATKSGTTYSRNYTFTEEINGSKNYTVYFKDGLGNTNTQTFKVYNIDNTAPRIMSNSIVNKQIVLTGNDKNGSNIEGSGIAGYRYLGSSQESVTMTESNSKLTTSHQIPLTEFEQVKYAYIMAVDRAGNTSEMIRIELPTYQIAVNPNGGSWRGSNTVTSLRGYQNGQVVPIEKPTRVGYEFAGWEISAGSMRNTSYTVTVSDAILQAQWNLVSPTIENKIETSVNTVSTTDTRSKRG